MQNAIDNSVKLYNLLHALLDKIYLATFSSIIIPNSFAIKINENFISLT